MAVSLTDSEARALADYIRIRGFNHEDEIGVILTKCLRLQGAGADQRKWETK